MAECDKSGLALCSRSVLSVAVAEPKFGFGHLSGRVECDMTSKKKRRTNQENAKKSTGPKSQEGKETSSQNSLKHGIWAKQLTISPAETADYGKLVNDLDALLKPKGPILQYYFDEIVLCMWRLKKLVVFGNPQFRAWDGGPLLTADKPADAEKLEVPDEPTSSKSEFEERVKQNDRNTLKAQREALRKLEEAIRSKRSLHADEKEYLQKFFGPHFVDALAPALPTSYEVLSAGMDKNIEMRSKNYGLPLELFKAQGPKSEGDAEQSSTAKVVTKEFPTKLLLEVISWRLEKLDSELEEQVKIKNKVSSPDLLALSVDLQLRYSAALKRDLKKAIDAYFHYKPVASQKSGK
jgi:hypothetical protein